jgi:L,D-transpeptidase ErfK/SrfK
MVGQVMTESITPGDTLADLANQYDLGYDEILMANPGVDPWNPEPGQTVRLPLQFILPKTVHQGIVLNVAEMRLYYYPKPGGNVVLTYPIGVGREGWNTPVGVTKVTTKVAGPSWTPPASIRAEHAADGEKLPAVVPPGPNNPLGPYALRLGIPGYLIHGSNKPYGAGMRVSHGCVRLQNDDITYLFRTVPVGTRVEIINQPYKLATVGQTLYLEAHPPFEEDGQTPTNRFIQSLKNTLRSNERVSLDWNTILLELTQPSGIPVVVGHIGSGEPAQQISAPLMARTAAPGPSKAPVQGEVQRGAWYVETGHFTTDQEAQVMARELAHLGLEAIIRHSATQPGALAVLAGPFQSEFDATGVQNRLRKAGITAQLHRS